MKRQIWLFKKLNLSLRTEVLVNISLLMLAAILLIGFTMTKIHEKNIIEEKIRHGKGMTQDVQSLIVYLFRDRREFSFGDLQVQEEIREFARTYTKEKGFDDFLITDPQLRIVGSMKPDVIGRYCASPALKSAVESGQFRSQVESSGGFFWTRYDSVIVSSPLWSRGRMVGGVLMEVPAADVMLRLFESKRIILTAIVFDGIVLLIFGGFLLSHVLVKPLRDLARLTQRISEGDFSETIQVTSKNEIGQLIDSFNRMILRLKENQESIESYLESLEITNRKLKEAQEELLRSEKLASIGRFAAGVAHEVGNPLGAILGYTSILEGGGVPEEEGRDYLKRIEKEIERINRIVRELLDFARPSKQEVKDVKVNPVIDNALSLLSYQKNFRNIQTELKLHPHLPCIRGNETQLSQVFINVILNAVDAMAQGGTLRIETEPFVVEHLLTEPIHRLHPRRRRGDPAESDYFHLRKPDPLSAMLTKFSRGDTLVKIQISDTGTGIANEDLKKIFDPFFTTKDPDKGTGLGLSVSLRIIESMGGEIKVESELGKGTKFEIYFPAVKQEICDSGLSSH